MSVSEVDVEIWRGSNRPVIWELADDNGSLFTIDPGAVFQLVIGYRGTSIITKLTSGSGIAVDIPTARITFTPTDAESRLVPLGAVASYELEMRLAGVETPVAFGRVNGRGGLNTDV